MYRRGPSFGCVVAAMASLLVNSSSGAATVEALFPPFVHPTEHTHSHAHEEYGQCSAQDREADAGFIGITSPDFFETNPDGSLPKPEAPAKGTTVTAAALAPATTQPGGALTGKIVFTSGGHGWTYANGDESITRWYTQRGVTQEMNEDYGNMDQTTLFAYYCFNAGATVVPLRPVGHQTNEVVLDNTSGSVTWSGTWTDSTSTLYYGAAGQTPYRYASVSATETATATYTPNIPVTGFYPVYAWTRHGSDRTSQLYKIRHTGGESQVRIPHDMVGNGWIYLGTYYFNAGSATNGAVVISNLRPTPTYGSVVIADAIRFGNGMGNVVPTPKTTEATTTSGYPREEEASRYWIQRAVGQGQSSTLYNTSSDDNSDNVGAPARMAREMNRGEAGQLADRVYVGFHSNAGGGRGCVGLYNNETLFPGTSTPNQARLALLVSTEVDSDMKVLPLEVPWQSRTLAYARSDYAFGEIRGDVNGDEMDATILEVAFHDEVSDGKLLRDPKMRNWVARGALQGILRYFSEFDTNFVLTYLPEPPYNVRSIATNSGVTISWNAPIASRRSQPATNYVVYRSTDGYGFGNPVYVGSTATSITLSNLATDTDLYFRVAAINAGGESLPSETVGCRRASDISAQRVLFVNGYTRLDRFMNLRHTPNANAWTPPGKSGTMERVLPRSNNSFDYVVQHGDAISAANMAFDSCSRMAVTNGSIKLTNYTVVIWAAGEELTGNIDSVAQSLLTSYLQSGRGLFVSGSEIARELGASTSSAANKSFLQNRLHATLASDSHTNSASYTATAAGDGIFAGNSSLSIDDGTKGIYWVKTPEVLTAAGGGAKAALNYSSGIGSAAIQYDGSAGGGRVVYFGFPFETITLAARRNSYMADILTYLSVPPPAGSPTITLAPVNQTVNRYADVTFNVGASGQAPLLFQWRYNGVDIPGETDDSLTLLNVQTNQAGQYSIVVSNSIGSTSASATLTVNIPTVTETFFADTFDTNSAALWITNKSSTDTAVTFNYNYSTNGIPSAPNSTGGTTRGVRFDANMVSSNFQAICISPNGKSFTGDFDLKFDMWINANGPFPGGGRGSTEHLTAGVGTTGTRVQWGNTNSTSDGTWFAVDGEGQAGDTTSSVVDFMIYVGATQQSTNTGFYSAGKGADARGNNHSYYSSTFPGGQTAPASQISAYPNQTGSLAVGSVGFKWRDVRISKRGTTVDWYIDNLRIGSVTNATFSGNNIFVGFWDGFISTSDNPAVSFGLIDNLRVQRTTDAIFPAITAQPTNKSVIQGSNVTFTVSATGTTNLFYQWRLNGGNIAGATAASYTITNAQPSAEGTYSVVVTNIAGKITSTNATLTVIVPPAIVTQPDSQNARVGDSVEFSVELTGTEPLVFQWFYNGGPISGATGSSLSLTNVQASDAGNYYLTVTNAAGSAISDVAVLSIETAPVTHFASIGFNENQQLQLQLRGAPGSSFSIQTSTNLTTWNTVTNVVIGDDQTAEFIEQSALTNAHQFYRAVSAP